MQHPSEIWAESDGNDGSSSTSTGPALLQHMRQVLRPPIVVFIAAADAGSYWSEGSSARP